MLHIGFGFRAFLNPNRSGSASGILRRVLIQYPQLTAAKVSNPKCRGKCGNFLDISKGISQSGMCKFESSEVSHPVLRLATVCNLRLTGPEIPAFRAFDFVSRLPISQSGSESAESLRPCPRKFPFCRDFRRRPVRSRLPPEDDRR